MPTFARNTLQDSVEMKANVDRPVPNHRKLSIRLNVRHLVQAEFFRNLF